MDHASEIQTEDDNYIQCDIPREDSTKSANELERNDPQKDSDSSTQSVFSPESPNSIDVDNNEITDLSLHENTNFNELSPNASGSSTSRYKKEEEDMLASLAKGPFAGLLNYGTTCYLNTLLQGLYMTPEFRELVWSWTADDIKPLTFPHELQKLFVAMNVSNRRVLGTRNLMKAADCFLQFQNEQQDVVELWHMLLITFEQQFEGSSEFQKIEVFYEGLFMDYVKCLECNNFKRKSECFREISLTVKSLNKTYESLEESLNAYIEPELLDGPNQYACDKCNKKCDAHKGLAVLKLPYILYFHLKRFAYDVQRMKLNDKVTYPEYLNLDDFMNKNEEITKGYSSDTLPQDAWKRGYGDPSIDGGKFVNSAYFLGYRQVNAQKNVMSVETASIPKAIRSKLEETNYEDLQIFDTPLLRHSPVQLEGTRVNVYFLPQNKQLISKLSVVELKCTSETMLADVKRIAVDKFDFNISPPLHLCRLVQYNDVFGVVEQSFDTEKITIGCVGYTTFLLEVCDDNQNFKKIESTEIMFKAYKINVLQEQITAEIIVKVPLTATVCEMVDIVAKQNMMDPFTTCVIIDSLGEEPRLLSNQSFPLKQFIQPNCSYYVTDQGNSVNYGTEFFVCNLEKLVKKFRRFIHVTLRYPSTYNLIEKDLPNSEYYPSFLGDERIINTWTSTAQANNNESLVGITVPLKGKLPWLYWLVGQLIGIDDQLIDIFRRDCGDTVTKGRKVISYNISIQDAMGLDFYVFSIPFDLRVSVRECVSVYVTLLDLMDMNSLKVQVKIEIPLPYTVGLCKRKAIAAIAEKYNLVLQYDKCRFRKFVHGCATTVYGDYENIEKSMMSAMDVNYKFCIQNVAAGQKLYSRKPEAVFIFAIRHHLQTNTLGLAKDIFLEENNYDLFVKALCSQTDIPLEYLMICVTTLRYPYEVDITPINTITGWLPASMGLLNWCRQINNDGKVVLYQDVRELNNNNAMQPMKLIKLDLKTKKTSARNMTNTVINGSQDKEDSSSARTSFVKSCHFRTIAQTEINKDIAEINNIDKNENINFNTPENQGNENSG